MMLPPVLHQHTITVRRREQTGVDDYNNPVTQDTEHIIGGCNVQPIARNTSEALGNGDLVTGRWLLSAPLDADLLADDQVVFDGELYQVTGYPQRFTTPLGILDHVEALLDRWTG